MYWGGTRRIDMAVSSPHAGDIADSIPPGAGSMFHEFATAPGARLASSA
jgi:hypothetical protein